MNKYRIIVLFLVALISCKKNRDEIFPSVSFVTPSNLSSFQVLESIYFKVNASDETKLETVTVYLLNNNYINAGTPVTFNCDENSETVEGFIIANDIHLASGTYYLKAVAFDGYNEKVTYREIYLNEVPLQLKREIIVRTSASTVFLDSLSGNTLNNFHSINSDFSTFLVDSYNQSISVGGSWVSPLTVQEANYFSPRFTVNNTGSGSTAFFTFQQMAENKFFVSDRSGKIKSYQKSSQPSDVIDLGNYYSESFCVDGDYLYSASVYSTGSARSIQKYYIPSGTLQQSAASSLEIRKIFTLNDETFALFGNENEIGKIKIYDGTANGVSEPFIFSGDKIWDVCSVGNDIFLVGGQNGLYRINLSSQTETVVFNGSPVHHIRQEIISGNIYLSSVNQLSIYNQNLNLILNSTAADSIAEIDFLYNK